MNYEQMFAAMRALSPYPAALHMRKPGDWYVSLPGVEIKAVPFFGALVNLVHHRKMP